MKCLKSVTSPEGIFFPGETKEPAPMMECFPMVTPSRIMLPASILTSSSTVHACKIDPGSSG